MIKPPMLGSLSEVRDRYVNIIISDHKLRKYFPP